MKEPLTKEDFELIISSLQFTRMKFEKTQYPTYELRQSQLERVDSVLNKVRALRDKSKES